MTPTTVEPPLDPFCGTSHWAVDGCPGLEPQPELVECDGCHEMVEQTYQPQGSLSDYCRPCFETETQNL